MTLLLALIGRLLATAGEVVSGGLPIGAPALSSLLLVGVLGVASVAVLVAATRILASLVSGVRTLPVADPREDADLRVRVVQSDPDAEGHVRARAPGWSTPTAARLRPSL
ncbi:DUF6412 domain-containing protein [Frondihabitans cladoniiphilus]|uniref:Uncharacterized protein n=1 Tax=Frondihabitans cladoniiphilus TaxID=715785 RepID=A0ABP8VSB4_9MICO